MDSITGAAQTILVWLGASTAILVALGAIWRKAIHPLNTKVSKLLEISEYEFNPNGGKSLADKVNYVVAAQETNTAAVSVLALGQSGLDKRLSAIDAAVNETGVALREREKELLERIMALDVLRATVDALNAKVEELHAAALAKAESREMPPEPTEAPAGSAILPRQIVALEPDHGEEWNGK